MMLNVHLKAHGSSKGSRWFFQDLHRDEDSPGNRYGAAGAAGAADRSSGAAEAAAGVIRSVPECPECPDSGLPKRSQAPNVARTIENMHIQVTCMYDDGNDINDSMI